MRALALLSLVGAAILLSGQSQPDPVARLAAAKAEIAAARARARALQERSREAGDAAVRARAEQAVAAVRLQEIEAGVAAASARLAVLRQRQREQERRLAAWRRPLVQLLAALQSQARRPATAALVQPGSLRDAVHLRILLATMQPEIERRTVAVRAEAARAGALRARAAAAMTELQTQQRRAARQQQELAALERQARRQSAAFELGARTETERAQRLATDAVTLEQLVRSLGSEAGLRSRLAALPGPRPRPTRLAQDLPAAEAAGPGASLSYQLPVLGPIARGFGEKLPSGTRARGVTIAARPGALVVAPAAGRVSFAGLFRGYGAIAILDHGGGHVSLITGLSAHTARTGDRVARGGPIGRAGKDGVTVELRRAGEAVDLSQFVA